MGLIKFLPLLKTTHCSFSYPPVVTVPTILLLPNKATRNKNLHLLSPQPHNIHPATAACLCLFAAKLLKYLFLNFRTTSF